MIIVEVTHDLYFGKGFGDTGVQGITIPAYLKNGKLMIGHNGESERLLPYCTLNYDVKDFKFFCNHKYRRSSEYNLHYIYKGIPFEIMGVIAAGKGNRDKLCTFLSPCRQGTFFCKCKDCGENFVIDCYESPFYYSHDLMIPTIRCRGCINKRKIKT